MVFCNYSKPYCTRLTTGIQTNIGQHKEGKESDGMPEQKLEVRMLGGFSVMYAGKEIVIDRSFVSKTVVFDSCAGWRVEGNID